MKRYHSYSIYTLLFTFLIGITDLQSQIFPHLQGFTSGAEFCNHKKLNSPNFSQLAPVDNSLGHTFDVLNYELDLDLYNNFITPYPKNFVATNIITIKIDTALTKFKLNAVNTSLEIDSITAPAVTFTHTGNILEITLDRQYQVGETLSVKIYYKHKNVSDNAFYVSNGFVFTDCEPEGARKWFPCWDKPSDKATVSLRAKTPSNVKLGSNGRLADSVLIADTIYYHWISRDPVPTYLVVITARVNYNLSIVNYVSPTDPNYTFPIRFYYNPGENPSAMMNMITPLTNFFSEIFGEHPFEKNGFATLNNQFTWGGMENQTLTSLCPNCWNEMLVVHEYAHQWFGDMITCATWADIFVNEGFATYSESLWREHTQGYSAYKNNIVSSANNYKGGNPGWAISNPSWAVTTPSANVLFNYQITYLKSACVMHLLRYVLGDSLFFKSVYDYANSQFKYKSATIQDFRGIVEATTNRDLGWFFDQWIYSPNHPNYANQYAISEDKYSILFIARQTQTNTVFFKMPIEIKVSFADGTDTLFTEINDVNNQNFLYQFTKQVDTVRFDPNNQIVLKNATITKIDYPTNISEFVNAEMSFNLMQNYPNPFNPSTTISFTLPENSFVNLSVYNTLGQKVKEIENGYLTNGNHTKVFHGGDLSSGIYYYVLYANNNQLVRKMILNK